MSSTTAAIDPARGTAKGEDAVLNVAGQGELALPVVVGTENEAGIDIQALRSKTGCITLDPGFGNTGACESKVTFIDGEKGILQYRGFAIEELAAKSGFVEAAWLLIYGELPTASQLAAFEADLTAHQKLPAEMPAFFAGFPAAAHPMAMISAAVNACGCHYLDLLEPEISDEQFRKASAILIGQVRGLAAAGCRRARGELPIDPDPSLGYTANFLHLMYSTLGKRHEPSPEAVRALDQVLLLHADHEQNCSTSTVRMVGSANANLFASIAAGICALWGPLHGGANMAVVEMLESIREGGESPKTVVEKVKKKQFRLMGFGHRVYKNFDPRAKILEKSCTELLDKLGLDDPLLDTARELADLALNDSYFVDRKLYPNVDFYSGIILRALKIPLNMFTVMFAIGRMPGWIAHWYELTKDPDRRITRPRQIYTGATLRPYVPIESRG